MYRHSGDSSIPLSNTNYQQAPGGQNSAYGPPGAGMEKNYNQASPPLPFITPGSMSKLSSRYEIGPKPKRRVWPWIVGGLILIAVILGAVLGGVLGSRAANDDDSGSKKNQDSSGNADASTRTKGSGGFALIPTATDQYGNPMYPTQTGSARLSAPTTLANDSLSCGDDPASGLSLDSPRTTHPLLIAPDYKWSCLPKLIAGDSYMSYWNDTIFSNATAFYDLSPTHYSIDGGLTGSGVLDVAREVQLRIKHWAYAYKLSNDTKWVDRVWREVQTAAGNSTDNQYFGVAGNNWNSGHYLDLAEFTEAFAIAYDWMYDAWTDEQRNAIMWSILNLGLSYGKNVYDDPDGAGADYSWWTKVDGNWNCVCNKGMAMGALAIINEDPTGTAKGIISKAVSNAAEHCSFAPSPEGTWSETANYWYFGTYSHVELAASLLSATGSTQNLLDVNPGMRLSSTYHMYVTGMQGLFAYGDTGPNKFTATANGLMFYGREYDMPVYTLFQRDRGDAPDPMSMFYYDPQVSGQFWDGLPLDHWFSNTTDGWFSARSSWTDNDGMYIAMKAGELTGHQTHGDLDAGTFVLDAMGQRWAGEYGSGDYLSQGYFSSEDQDSARWLYFRKRTEGQNTLLIGDMNQNVAGVPTTTFETTNDTQTDLVYTAPNSSTCVFTADLGEMYNSTSSVKRAIRYLNGRRQVLLRDEVTATADIQWRMQTNATISLSNNDKTATLKLGDQTLIAEITGASADAATFSQLAATRLSGDPTSSDGYTMSADQPNGDAKILAISVDAGTQVIEVLFNPQWEGSSNGDFVTPPAVAIADWSLTSHD
ncbi:hypothetical protein JCM11641_003383 [Rhodosporidiobolus odoratus]